MENTTQTELQQRLIVSIDNIGIPKEEEQHRQKGTDAEHIEALAESFRLTGIEGHIAELEATPDDLNLFKVVNGVHRYMAYRELHKKYPDSFPKTGEYVVVGPFKDADARKTWQFRKNVYRPHKSVDVEDAVAHIKLQYVKGLEDKTFLEADSEGNLRSQIKPLVEREVPFFSPKRKSKVVQAVVHDILKKKFVSVR